MYYTWKHAAVPGKKVSVETWVLAYGGVGIVTGLATYGWHIMGLFGVKSVKITAARGFCIELATALVVIVSARFGEQLASPFPQRSLPPPAARAACATWLAGWLALTWAP